MSLNCEQKFDSTVASDVVLEKSESIKDFDSIPGPKPSLPFIGTGWQYFKFGEYLIKGYIFIKSFVSFLCLSRSIRFDSIT